MYHFTEGVLDNKKVYTGQGQDQSNFFLHATEHLSQQSIRNNYLSYRDSNPANKSVKLESLFHVMLLG